MGTMASRAESRAINSPVCGCVGGCDAIVEGAEVDCKERPYTQIKICIYDVIKRNLKGFYPSTHENSGK